MVKNNSPLHAHKTLHDADVDHPGPYRWGMSAPTLNSEVSLISNHLIC